MLAYLLFVPMFPHTGAPPTVEDPLWQGTPWTAPIPWIITGLIILGFFWVSYRGYRKHS